MKKTGGKASGKSAKAATRADTRRVAARATRPRQVLVDPSAREPTKAAEKKRPAHGAAPRPTTNEGRGPVLAGRPKLLAGGNPQIAKADGDAPVQAYIAAMPGWKRDVGRRLDALVEHTAPNVCKAVKWNSPFYGSKGQGWFLSFHVFTRYVKVTFFQGVLLRPNPPGGTGREARWIDIHEDDLDETQMATWIRQAAVLPGWGKA